MENKKETKVIRVLSRQNFNNYIKEHNWIENGVPTNVAIIEIFNSDNCENATNRFKIEDEFNYINDLQSAKLFGSNVLHLVFDDILGEQNIKVDNIEKSLELFRFHHAKKIINFIDTNFDANTWIIHCSAGISRSGAVGKFIFDLFKDLGIDVEFPDIINIQPNNHVLTLLKNTHKCFEFSKFEDDIFIFPSIVKTQLIPFDISNDDIKNNPEKFLKFFEKELNEKYSNVYDIMNDILNDNIVLKYILQHIYEQFIFDKSE